MTLPLGYFAMQEAADLVAAVNATDRLYMFGENCCYWGFVGAWKQWMRDGELGLFGRGPNMVRAVEVRRLDCGRFD